MQQVRNNLKWADGKAIKVEFDIQFLDLLGPKTDADLAPVPKQGKQPKDKQPKKTVEARKTEAAKKTEVTKKTEAAEKTEAAKEGEISIASRNILSMCW